MAGPWEDYAPKATKERGPWDDYGAEANRGIVDKVTAPFRHGFSEAAEGYQKSLHETGNDGVISDTIGSVAEASKPKDYTPAHVTLSPKTWGDIPKALAESVPSLAPDFAVGAAGAAAGSVLGPVGAIGGGLIGATGSYLARNYGSDARASSIAAGGNNNSELTAGDKARALLMGTVGGAASRLSLGALGTPVKAGAGSMISQLVPQIAKGAAIDTATNVGQEAAHQAIIDQKLDVDKLGGAAVTGAATGMGLRGISAIKDVNAASKFKDTDQAHANPVANDLIGVESPHTAGSGKDSYFRVKKVEDTYATIADKALSKKPMSERLSALEEANPLDKTRDTITDVQKDLAEGRKPSQADLDLIHNRVGDIDIGGTSLTDILKRQHELNDLKSKGNWDTKAETFTGGVSSTKFAQNVLNPMSKFGAMADVGAMTYALSGHTLPGLSAMHAIVNPVHAAMVPVAQASTFAGLHALDRITGSRNPLQMYTNRFSGDSANPLGTPSSPAAGPTGPRGADIAASVQSAREAAVLEKFQQNHERTDATVQNRKFDKGVNEQVSAARALNKQRETSINGAANALENQKQAAMAKESKTEFDGPKSDATLAIRVAKYKESLKAREEATALQAEAATTRLEKAQAASEAKAQKAADKEAKQSDRDAAKRAAQELKAAEKAAASAQKTAEGAKRESAKASEADPATTPIKTKYGTRNQLVDEIRVSERAIKNGINKRAGTRKQAMEDMLTVPLSKDGHHYMIDHTKSILDHSFENNSSHTARDRIESVLDGLSRPDAKLMRDHLRSKGFYESWKD